MGAGLSRTLWGMANNETAPVANVKEAGNPGGIITVKRGNASVTTVEPLERNGELAFPNSIAVYDRVRTDAQVESVLNAISLPILSAQWDLNVEGVDGSVVALVRTELGLPEPGKAMAGRQRRQGISWLEHLEQVLTMVWAGFMCFEQVYEIAPARPDQTDIGLAEIIHLRKLAPRLPRTIAEIQVEKDGGLKAVVQQGDGNEKDVKIPAENLVMYTHRKEGADWSGRSILRAAYRPWFIKETLVKLDAQAGERNSMGIPVVTYDDNSEGNADEADRIARTMRAGETAGLSYKSGQYSVEILGMKGSVVDLLPKINYHDQQIAKSALAMFLDLGHDAGARSLGETHLQLFIRSIQHLANKLAETATEHIIRDLVELNFGEGTPYPVLTPGNLAANEGVTAEDLASFVNAGVISVDEKLEDYIRANNGLPVSDPATRRETSKSPLSDLGMSLKHEENIDALVNRVATVRARRAAAGDESV